MGDYKIGDICKLEKGKQIDTSLLSDDNKYKYINGGVTESGYYTDFNTSGRVVTVSEGGASCGFVNYIEEPFWCGYHCYRLTEIQFPPKYVYYALKANQEKIMALRTGSAMPNIKKSSFAQLEVKLSEKAEEQDRITSVLEHIDNLISKRQNQCDLLDELVKARFVEMFGDVMQNRKKWEVYKFSDIAVSRLGKMLDAKKQTGKCAFPYLANFNVQWFRFDLENLNQMDFDENDRIEFELKDGDLLVCEGGEIGRCAVWHNELQPCYFQKALHRVRCNQQLVHPDYLAWWFKYNCDNGGFAAIAGAKATIAHLPGVKLKQLDVAVPPMELQTQFAAFVQSTDQTKSTIQAGIDQLETLKKSLMQEYFG